MKKAIKTLGLLFLAFFVLPLAAADPADEHRGFRIEPSLMFGEGSNDVLIGSTADNQSIDLSGGGGFGGAVTFGYGMRNVEFDLSVGTQETDLSRNLSNGGGDFTRNQLLGSVLYRKFFSDDNLMKFGGGVGMYMSGEQDVRFQLDGEFQRIIEYDDSVGYHVMAEYERFFGDRWSWLAGLKYYDVNYDAERCIENGVTIPLPQVQDDMREFDGAGVDFIVGLAYNFG